MSGGGSHEVSTSPQTRGGGPSALLSAADLCMPTPAHVLYAWHRNALLGVFGEAPETFNEEPECGWFKTRLVKGGPWVPARIWMYQPIDEDTGELVGDEKLQCEVNGQHADADEVWSRLCGNPISEQEFNYMTATRRHAAFYEPDHPAANPRQPIDWLTAPIPQFPTKGQRP